jgi:hypothetical protein
MEGESQRGLKRVRKASLANTRDLQKTEKERANKKRRHTEGSFSHRHRKR